MRYSAACEHQAHTLPGGGGYKYTSAALCSVKLLQQRVLFQRGIGSIFRLLPYRDEQR